MADNTNIARNLRIADRDYTYYDLNIAAQEFACPDLTKLPVVLKIVAENLVRRIDGQTVTVEDVCELARWVKTRTSKQQIQYMPARILMQDFTGVPSVVDLAAMRDAVVQLGGDPDQVNPQCNVDLVIDHSVMVDDYGQNALSFNLGREMERNQERYKFLKWGQAAFTNFRVVPPGNGICHQVNLEFLAPVVATQKIGEQTLAYPDTLVGLDSHTTMINGLGVLGWGVGGIEAEAVMLGQPISMVVPEVVGFYLDGRLRPGVTATDLVLTVTEQLRSHGVVAKFVEFYGPGLENLPLAMRATIANMAPEYGATCGFFPVDSEALKYLELTNRDPEQIELVQHYSKAQGLWHDPTLRPDTFTSHLAIDLGAVKASLAGPKRPQDRVNLDEMSIKVDQILRDQMPDTDLDTNFPVAGADYAMHHGDVVIAAITSCTNTSNPDVMIAAGMVARNAARLGLQVKPWVKTSLAPGSRVVAKYLEDLNLLDDFQSIGYNLVGFGCTTCIGNSGPLHKEIEQTIVDGDLHVSSVLSGNRNFEGRIHPLTKSNWLASPPLVVAYALAGTTRIDLAKDPVTTDSDGNPVMLADLWPQPDELENAIATIDKSMFKESYANVFAGDDEWQAIEVTRSATYHWAEDSTYIRLPNFFQDITAKPDGLSDIRNARILMLLGASVTTDHISPAGNIPTDGPAGQYLRDHGVSQFEFNSFGSRRGNHEVMMRGTLANIRIRNKIAGSKEGGFTRTSPDGELMSVYDAAMQYQSSGTSTVIVAKREYGTGSSRDWAAKGVNLLGVKAVIAESFERIHRSNLIGMGVLPLRFKRGDSQEKWELTGYEKISISGIATMTDPGATLVVTVEFLDGRKVEHEVIVRIETQNELTYYQNGGILHYVLRQMAAQA